MISYKPLWQTLVRKEMNKMQLKELAGFSNGTLAKMGKGEYVGLKQIDLICNVLDCRIEDVIEFVRS